MCRRPLSIVALPFSRPGLARLLLAATALLLVGLAGCREDAPAAPAAEEPTEPEPLTRVTDVAPLRAPAPKPFAEEEEPGHRDDDRGLAPGTAAPDAALRDADGRTVQLNELYRRGPLLIVFYRGGWCPYCNFQVWELANKYAQFRASGVRIAMLSVDEPDGASVTRGAYNVPFSLLSDPDLVAHKAFDVDFALDDAGVERLQSFGIDLEAWSRRKHHTIAIPSAFFIVDGTVRWAHVETDYKKRPSVGQLLEMVRRLAPSPPPASEP